jgi:uroporphyrinogen III methyltransferase/synthase
VSGPRVLVVRSGANPFARMGVLLGIEVVERLSHSIAPVDVPLTAFDRRADFTVFTSQVTVERLLSGGELEVRLRAAARAGRVVAVGSATAEALRRHGLAPAIVGGGSGDATVEALESQLDGCHVLLPCAEDASPELPDALRSRVATVTCVVVYRKIPIPADADLARQIVDRPFAAFCATSPSAARWLFAGLPDAAADRLRRTQAVVLGRYTRRYLESHGVERIAEAEEARFESAARLLEELATASAEP